MGCYMIRYTRSTGYKIRKGKAMDGLNCFQKDFMQAMALIQEKCVQVSLVKNCNAESLEDVLYDVTYDVIVEMMELIDGYEDVNIGKLSVVCEKTGENLKYNPHIELHDVVCEYLKDSENLPNWV